MWNLERQFNSGIKSVEDTIFLKNGKTPGRRSSFILPAARFYKPVF